MPKFLWHTVEQWFLNFNIHQYPMDIWLNSFLNLRPGNSDTVGWEWPWICIFNELMVDATATSPGTWDYTLRNTTIKTTINTTLKTQGEKNTGVYPLCATAGPPFSHTHWACIGNRITNILTVSMVADLCRLKMTISRCQHGIALPGLNGNNEIPVH